MCDVILVVLIAIGCPILQKHYKEIVNHVNPEQLLVQLKTNGLVTTEEEYILMNSDLTPQKRTKLLLIQLQFKDPSNCIQLFYQCLRAEKEHSGHQYLADLLEPDIRAGESQPPVTSPGGASNSTAAITGAEIDSILPKLKLYWMKVAEMLSAPQEMVDNITTSSQDPEEQARMFFQQYTVYSRKEKIYHALDQLGAE